MFQQRAESEGVQPNHHNNMPNSISEEPINRLPSNFGGSAHQSQFFYMPNSSLEEPIHQLPSNLGGSAHQSDQFFPGSDVCSPSSNQGGSAHQPQLSEAQFLANELWRGLVQPNVNRGGWLSPAQSLGVQPNVNPGQSVPQDVNPGGRLSPTRSEDQFDIPDGGVQPNVNPGGSAHHPQLTETQSAPNEIAPSVKKVQEAKLKHECAVELVNQVCRHLSIMSFQDIQRFLTNPEFNILDRAIKNGIKEIVGTLLQLFPDLINVQVLDNRNILQAAVEYRQENIVNVMKEISKTTTKNLGSSGITEKIGVTLHLAGKLAPDSRLFLVSGAALQMQRELQWFKEVEEITFTYRREWEDENGETPKKVFRTAHTDLAAKGQTWMKDTADYCMLVSTLIATVLFAAAFTVPGGNSNDNGIAIFLHMNAFMIFAISDALGLFSSLTSVLMFLAILTARYEQDDFLESLPKKLIIGLGSLFIAIAAMIIAFVATLTIVLGERWYWVSVLITLVASFPVAIFVKLQLLLFVQMVRSGDKIGSIGGEATSTKQEEQRDGDEVKCCGGYTTTSTEQEAALTATMTETK
ncbi:hypothetical protein LWI29_033806 [Acer saccharum]|uniref:PGG domain-containing protein n=1 Tax=Acer saccharum TaxID=4024 RepID=A0AA39SXS7_ACESA|nr:hypothetical protein LWI29_033806 [Acer saccharum]